MRAVPKAPRRLCQDVPRPFKASFPGLLATFFIAFRLLLNTFNRRPVLFLGLHPIKRALKAFFPQLRNRRQEAPEALRSVLCMLRDGQEGDVQFVASRRLSLLCPLALARVERPVRGRRGKQEPRMPYKR